MKRTTAVILAVSLAMSMTMAATPAASWGKFSNWLIGAHKDIKKHWKDKKHCYAHGISLTAYHLTDAQLAKCRR